LQWTLHSFSNSMNKVAVASLALLLLLVAEGVYLSVRFDSQYLAAHPVFAARALGLAPHVLRLVIAILATAVLLSRGRAMQSIVAFAAAAPHSLRPAFVCVHTIALLSFVRASERVFDAQFTASDRAAAWTAAWLASGVVTVLSWALAITPLPRWTSAITQGRALLQKSVGIGVGVWSAGLLTQHLWSSLALYTFNVVEWMLGLIYPVVVTVPSKFIIGTPDFRVMVSRQCSGLEGIGLILAFLSIYLWLFRRDLRFPAALALLPLGAVAVWSLNAVRIAGLIVIGSSGWPDVALGGFHSQAGWLAFNGVGLGVAAMTLHSGWFAATVTHRRSDAAAVCGDLTPAYLTPFMAMLAAGMVTSGMSSTFEWLYPFRLLAVMAVLWFFRRSYGALSWRLSLPAATIGIFMGGIWIAFAAPEVNDKSFWPVALASIPLPLAAAWLFARLLGFLVFVPIVEELAFRGFLARRIIDSDFDKVPLGTFSWSSFLVSSAVFGAMHGRLWIVGTLAGMLFAVAHYRRGSLGDAVQAHATANGVIALYVLRTGQWSIWS
jgi:exosortase E/protease (VPEID-CTERM system)